MPQAGHAYRFSFQGQEHDDEFNGSTGTSYAFEYRIHDPRVGRFLSIDPLAAKYAYNSPYAFSENRLIDSGELEGLEQTNRTSYRVQLGDCLECIDHERGYKIGTMQRENSWLENPHHIEVGWELRTPPMIGPGPSDWNEPPYQLSLLSATSTTDNPQSSAQATGAAQTHRTGPTASMREVPLALDNTIIQNESPWFDVGPFQQKTTSWIRFSNGADGILLNGKTFGENGPFSLDVGHRSSIGPLSLEAIYWGSPSTSLGLQYDKGEVTYGISNEGFEFSTASWVHLKSYDKYGWVGTTTITRPNEKTIGTAVGVGLGVMMMIRTGSYRTVPVSFR